MLQNQGLLVDKAKELASLLKNSKCYCGIICDCCENYIQCNSLRKLYYQLQEFIVSCDKH